MIGKDRKDIVYSGLNAANAQRLSGKYADFVTEDLRGINHRQARAKAMEQWLVDSVKDSGELALPDRKELDRKLFE